MKGYSHAITGAAAWTVVASPEILLSDLGEPFGVSLWDIPLAFGLLEVSPMTYALGLILTAGAALLPDIDHHNGTIAWSLPKVGFIPSPTKAMCRFVGKISGGHRHGTHSILGILVFILLSFLAGLWTLDIQGTEIAIGSGIFALFLTAFTLKVFHIGKSNAWALRWIISILFAAAITWWFPNEWNVLPIMVGIGCLAHCLGDMLTVGGVPWLWPLKPSSPKAIRNIPVLNKMWQKNGWFAFPILGTTDSSDDGWSREKVLTVVLSTYILVIGIITTFAYLSSGGNIA